MDGKAHMHVAGSGGIGPRPRRPSEEAQAAGPAVPSGVAFQDRDAFEAVAVRGRGPERRRLSPPPEQRRGEAAFNVEAPDGEAQPGVLLRWWRACQAHPFLRYVPIYAACATTVGAYFGIRNYLYLDAAKTYGALQDLRPTLLSAHRNISCALAAIQQRLNISDRINCPPP